jgi:Arc/MetJ family transcription regulator
MVLKLMRENPMRTTIALDDNLIRTAQEYTGLTEKSALMREALKALIEREAARRLAELGGASPDMAYIPRRKTKAK